MNMREIDIETLDKMFPKGYVIVYTLLDNQIRVAKYNPMNDETLHRCNEILTANE